MQYCVRPMSDYVPIYRSHKHVLRKKHRKIWVEYSEKKMKRLVLLMFFLASGLRLSLSQFLSESREFQDYRNFSYGYIEVLVLRQPFFLFFVLSMFMKFNSWFEFLCPTDEDHDELLLLGHYICKLLTQARRGESRYNVWRS